jgi:hypothetical protein
VTVIDPAQLSADDLTERLRASGALPHGHFTAVHSEARQTTILSTIARLRLRIGRSKAHFWSSPGVILVGARRAASSGTTRAFCPAMRSSASRSAALWTRSGAP